MKNEEMKFNKKDIVGLVLFGSIAWQIVLLICKPNLLWYYVALNVLIFMYFLVLVLYYIKHKNNRKAIIHGIFGLGGVILSSIGYLMVTN